MRNFWLMWKPYIIAGAAAVAAVVVVTAGVLAYRWYTAPDFDGIGDPAIDTMDPVTEDPVVAARTTVSAVWTHDPAKDDSELDAMERVRDRLTGRMLATLDTTDADAKALRAGNWDKWAASGDRVVTVATETDPPAATIDGPHATVELDVRRMVVHPDGVTTPYEEGTVRAELDNVGGAWKLASADYIRVH